MRDPTAVRLRTGAGIWGPDTIPTLKLCPPGTQPKADRLTTDDASLGPHRCRRLGGVRERPEALVAAAVCGGVKGGGRQPGIGSWLPFSSSAASVAVSLFSGSPPRATACAEPGYDLGTSLPKTIVFLGQDSDPMIPVEGIRVAGLSVTAGFQVASFSACGPVRPSACIGDVGCDVAFSKSVAATVLGIGRACQPLHGRSRQTTRRGVHSGLAHRRRACSVVIWPAR